jgi:hypothetical protein
MRLETCLEPGPAAISVVPVKVAVVDPLDGGVMVVAVVTWQPVVAAGCSLF